MNIKELFMNKIFVAVNALVHTFTHTRDILYQGNYKTHMRNKVTVMISFGVTSIVWPLCCNSMDLLVVPDH